MGLALLLALSAGVRAESEPFRIGAEAIPPSLSPGESGEIAVRFTIAPGHYLYAHQVGVTPKPSPDLSFGELEKPRGTRKEDPYLGTVFTYQGRVTLRLPVEVEPGADPGRRTVPLAVSFQGCTEKVCFMPEERTVKTALAVPAEAGSREPDPFRPLTDTEPLVPAEELGGTSETPTPRPASGPGETRGPIRRMAERFGLLGVLVGAFFWGFLASLTPCVYPMIPVTVSVVGAGSGGRVSRGLFLSILYVLGMSLTYAAFGVAAAWTGGLFGAYAGHPVVRILVAGLFLILALGMFDVVHIQMPRSVSARLGGAKGAGAVGVFLTGMASGAVVGPCVGPMLVGLLVYIAALGSHWQGFLIMWSFSLGMGMLFLVIGTFSGAVSALPRSGGWMVRLKHGFGWVMLALALYYIAPLLHQRVLFLLLGAFLMGTGVFLGALDPLRAEADRWRRLARTAGLVVLVLGGGYVARVALEPMHPPAGTSVVGPDGGVPSAAAIRWLQDEPAALAQARAQRRPVMVDFRADWCSACRRMEKETFPDPAVVRASRAFVNLKIDGTDPTDPQVRRLQKKYGVVGLPTILFLDAGGRVIPDHRITEFVPPRILLERMDAAASAG